MCNHTVLREESSNILRGHLSAANAESFAAFGVMRTVATRQRQSEVDSTGSALVAWMASKDEAALAQLYDLTVKRLHAYCWVSWVSPRLLSQ